MRYKKQKRRKDYLLPKIAIILHGKKKKKTKELDAEIKRQK